MASIPRPRVDAIDVAHYQIVIDEEAIPHLPVMTCKGSEGATYHDPTRPNWIRIFRDRAEIMGMYHWVRSDSSMEGQVQNLAACYREEGALPSDGQLAPGWIVQLDWERTYKNGVLVRDLTVAEIELWHKYADAVFGPGRVVTYGSDWVPNFPEWRRRNPDKPVWYANYSLSDLPSGGQQESAKYAACLWQWGSQVMVPGIDTASRPGIDVSQILNYSQILAAAHLEQLPPPNPLPEDDMPTVITNMAPRQFEGIVYQPGAIKWALMDDGTKRHMGIDHKLFGSPAGTPASNADLDACPDYVPPVTVIPPVVIPPITVPPLTGHISADLGAQGHITGSVG